MTLPACTRRSLSSTEQVQQDGDRDKERYQIPRGLQGWKSDQGDPEDEGREW